MIAEDYSYARILASDQVRVFAQDATPEQATQLQVSMVREPLAPIATPVTLTDARYGVVDKAYVRTIQDRTVSTQSQTMMIECSSVTDVLDIATGHAPYLTRPEQLAALIADLAH